MQQITWDSSAECCYLCKGTNFIEIMHGLIIKSLFGDQCLDGEYRVCLCKTCGLVQNFPRPSIEWLAEHYAEDIMFDNKNLKIESAKYHWATSPKSYLAQVLFLEQSTALNGKHVLEVGSGDGFFANLLMQKGAEVTVIEPNSIMAKKYRELGYHVFEDLFENVDTSEQFDCFVCRHVLEHIVNPLPFLQKLHRMLLDNGIGFIEVPNVQAFDNSDLIELPYDHLWHFCLDTLTIFLQQAGFIICACEELANPPVIRVIIKKANSSVPNKLLLDQEHVQRKISSLLEYGGHHEEMVKRIENQLINFLEDNKECKIYLHGATNHAAQLLSQFSWMTPCTVIDIDKGKYNKNFLGRFIVKHPDEIEVKNIVVIITAAVAMADIEQYWLERGLPSERMFNLYA